MKFTEEELKAVQSSVLFHYEAEERYIGKRYMGKWYISKNADLHIKKSKTLLRLEKHCQFSPVMHALHQSPFSVALHKVRYGILFSQLILQKTCVITDVHLSICFGLLLHGREPI